MSIPHTIRSTGNPIPPLSERFYSLIDAYKGAKVDVGILGVPSDTGVIQGGGRAGAALGPDAIRDALSRYGAAYNIERGVDLSVVKIADFGDIVCAPASTEETHQRLTAAVCEIVRLGAIPVLFGGGHDLTFGGVRGLTDALQVPVGGITLDAHLDVREVVKGKITSGTPFRNILDHLEQVSGAHFVEIGVNGLVNAKAHGDYLREKGAHLFTLSETRRRGIESVLEQGLEIAASQTGKIFCSIDLDVVAQAFAPGVSAPSPEGLRPEEAALAAYRFGLHEKTAYFDVMELNPHFDQDGRTARLAAALFIHFVTGVAERKMNRGR